MTKHLNTKTTSHTWEKIKNGFMSGAGKLGNQRHLAALRDAFALFTPLIIIGSLAVVMRTFVFGAAGGSMTSILGWIAKASGEINIQKQHVDPHTKQVVAAGWQLLHNFGVASSIGNFAFYTIERATYGAITLYFAFGVGYFMARSRGNDSPVICGFTTLAAVIAANGSIGWGPTFYIDSSGLMTGIIFGFISAELFCLLSKSKKLLIKMPAGVPPAVARSFAKLFPILFILLGISTIQVLFMSVAYAMSEMTANSKISHYGGYTMTIGDAIYYGIQSPFLQAASNKNADLGLGLIYALSISMLWFFGIHGSNVMNGVFGVIFITFLTDNVSSTEVFYSATKATGDHPIHIFAQGTFDGFIMLGGTAATIGWILASFLFSKKKSEKEMAKFSTPAGLFNINEPVIFGVPMMVNPTYAAPFILTTPILALTTYFAIRLGFVPIVKVWIPWTTPVPIGGLLATSMSWRGLVLALFNLIIAILIYIPFVMISNVKARRDNEELTYALIGRKTSEEKILIKENKLKKRNAKVQSSSESKATKLKKRSETSIPKKNAKTKTTAKKVGK